MDDAPHQDIHSDNIPHWASIKPPPKETLHLPSNEEIPLVQISPNQTQNTQYPPRNTQFQVDSHTNSPGESI